MANDRVMLEGSRVGDGGGEEEGENGGIELSLELSIGGSYAKSEKLMASGVKVDADTEEIGRSSGGSGEFGVLVDPQAKREIQALRRREARKKREGKPKRVSWKETNGCGSGSFNGNGGVNSYQDEIRVRARARARDNWDGLIERESKKGKIGDGIVGENNGSIPVGPVQFTNGLVNFYGGMTCLGAVGGNEVKSEKCGFQMTGCRSFRPYQGSRNSEGYCGKEGGPVSGSVSPSQSPLAFQDYQNLTLQGGNASDNGSNSSYSQPKIQQNKNTSSPTNPPEQSEPSNSSKQTESNQAIHSSADSPPNPSIKPSKDTKSDTKNSQLVNNKIPTPNIIRPPPLIPQTEINPDPTLRPHMPCVSTTGNGTNGKTVMGFLYKYNKDEVSIVCVCHGNSFSPAQFVEHAGGIDITNPLRHITVIPSSAFGV